MSIDAIVDERALREIYLTGFEIAVRGAQPATVMCAYNRVNGTYCSEHRRLLTEILREEWGYTGVVVSDWGAVNQRVKGVAAGLDLEMPGSGGQNDAVLVKAVEAGELDETVLDRAVERLLTLTLRLTGVLKEDASYDRNAHHALARQVAGEAAVLLKNEGRILPLAAVGPIALIGAFARRPVIRAPAARKSGRPDGNPLRCSSSLWVTSRLSVTRTGTACGAIRSINGAGGGL